MRAPGPGLAELELDAHGAECALDGFLPSAICRGAGRAGMEDSPGLDGSIVEDVADTALSKGANAEHILWPEVIDLGRERPVAGIEEGHAFCGPQLVWRAVTARVFQEAQGTVIQYEESFEELVGFAKAPSGPSP